MKKRADGLYQKRITVRGFRYSVYGKTQKEVNEKAEARRKEIEHGIAVEHEKITMNEFYKIWRKRREETNQVKKATLLIDDSRYKRIEKHFGKTRIKSICQEDVEQFQRLLLADQAIDISTANVILSLLKRILRGAVQRHIIISNPAQYVDRVREKVDKAEASQTIHRALNDDELQLFFTYAKDSVYCNFMKFLLYTGCRTNEASVLTWDDIDNEANEIHITKGLSRVTPTKYDVSTPKTRSSIRDLPLNEKIMELLTEQKEMQIALFGEDAGSGSARIFSKTDGGFVDAQKIDNTIAYFLKKMEKDGEGIDRFAAHSFRDCFATICLRQGMDFFTLSKLLGHRSLQMTQDLYCHLLPKDKQERYQKIEFAI